MSEFAASLEPAGRGALIVAVTGEVDLATAPEFAQHLYAALDSGASTVIVDLSACEFFDSSGLNVLAHHARRAGDGPRLSLVIPADGIVRPAIEIARFDQMFRIYPGREAALDGHVLDGGSALAPRKTEREGQGDHEPAGHSR